MIRRACDAKGERFLEDLVVPLRFIIWMQEEVNMRIDQSGKQSRSRQFDSSRARRNSRVVTRTGIGDGVPGYDHDPVVMGSRVDAIEDRRGDEN